MHLGRVTRQATNAPQRIYVATPLGDATMWFDAIFISLPIDEIQIRLSVNSRFIRDICCMA